MESNIFVINADEFTVHWKVTIPDDMKVPDGAAARFSTPEERVAALTSLTGKLLVALKQQGFKPDPSKAARKGGGNPNWKPKPTATDENGNKISCPQCGADVYDNRADNRERAARGEKQRPDLKCMKACGWLKWPAREEEEIPFA